jgi:DNA-binding transcriptional MerR regulator
MKPKRAVDELRPPQLSSDVARRFGVVPQTVLYWVRTGRLRATRTERGIHIFDPRDVDAFALARALTSVADEPDNGLTEAESDHRL